MTGGLGTLRHEWSNTSHAIYTGYDLQSARAIARDQYGAPIEDGDRAMTSVNPEARQSVIRDIDPERSTGCRYSDPETTRLNK